MTGNLNIKQKPIYGNCRVLDPNGDLLFLCLPKKINWYLDRNLATLISDDPMTIQLNFVPNGVGHNGDEYGLSEKENKCVVCGRETELTRHHIVPYTYRKHFPDDIKSHNSHDVVPICIEHHTEYEEKYGVPLKQEIATLYGAPLDVESHTRTSLTTVVKYAKLISNRYYSLPYKRIKKMVETIRQYHGDVGRLRHVILIYSSVDLSTTKAESHGQVVVNRVIEMDFLQGFVEIWRNNFVLSMEPKFMPEYWTVDRPIDKVNK